MSVAPIAEETDNLSVAGIVQTTTVTVDTVDGTPYTGVVEVAMIHGAYTELEIATPQDVTAVLDLIHADL